MGIINRTTRVCLIPNVSGVGGMVSFRGKLMQGLTERGIGVTFDLADTPYAAILVIGGTRDLAGLWHARRHGVRIVQRLDGMNWIHRKRRTGWRHYLRAEYGNIILSLIRSRLANQIIYQSKFSQKWWERVYGVDRTPWEVVYNGVDLNRYTPYGDGNVPTDHKRILLVEGSIAGGYEWGFETAIQMAECLRSKYYHSIELMVVGFVSATLQSDFVKKTKLKMNFTGRVPGENIPELDRSAHVAAFDTGALSELVTSDSGRLSPYRGDPWKLDPPDIDTLAESVNAIINNQIAYRTAARRRAEEAFSVEHMLKGYMDLLNL
jgi:glycosyltransferase involved in cell wall biosynthesis